MDGCGPLVTAPCAVWNVSLTGKARVASSTENVSVTAMDIGVFRPLRLPHLF